LDVSKYDAWNNDHYRTREVIEDDDNIGYINFSKMLACNDSDFNWIWEQIAFYNFFQQHIGKGNNKCFLNKDLISSSGESFFDVIKIITPDLVIAWGISDLLNSWMPQNIESEPIDKNINTLYRYKLYSNVSIWHIKHPSRSFPIFDWIEQYKRICNILNLPLLKK
jgi:hypothetical protein